jgi:dihydrofolate reductase
VVVATRDHLACDELACDCGTFGEEEQHIRRVRGVTPGEEVSRLKEQPGKDIAVGGAGLASACMKLELIDEWRLFVSPVLLGTGTPYFPNLDKRVNLKLVETKTFGSRVVYHRYSRISESR